MKERFDKLLEYLYWYLDANPHVAVAVVLLAMIVAACFLLLLVCMGGVVLLDLIFHWPLETVRVMVGVLVVVGVAWALSGRDF